MSDVDRAIITEEIISIIAISGTLIVIIKGMCVLFEFVYIYSIGYITNLFSNVTFRSDRDRDRNYNRDKMDRSQNRNYNSRGAPPQQQQRDERDNKPRRAPQNPDEIENRMPKFKADVKPVSIFRLDSFADKKKIFQIHLSLSICLQFRKYKCQTHMKFSTKKHPIEERTVYNLSGQLCLKTNAELHCI